MAIATPALAQDASAGVHGQHSGRAAAPKIYRVKYAVPDNATAEVRESNCRLETFYVVGITEPELHRDVRSALKSYEGGKIAGAVSAAPAGPEAGKAFESRSWIARPLAAILGVHVGVGRTTMLLATDPRPAPWR